MSTNMLHQVSTIFHPSQERFLPLYSTLVQQLLKYEENYERKKKFSLCFIKSEDDFGNKCNLKADSVNI